MLKFMLDTNICSYIVKYKPQSLRKKFDELGMEECCISSIILTELRYWVANNKKHHATSLGITLVTNNMKKFIHFPNLRLENWI